MKRFLVIFLVSLGLIQTQVEAKYNPKDDPRNKPKQQAPSTPAPKLMKPSNKNHYKPVPYQPQFNHNYNKPVYKNHFKIIPYKAPIYRNKVIIQKYYKPLPFIHREIIFFPFYGFRHYSPQLLLFPYSEQVIVNSYTIEKKEVFSNEKNALLSASISPDSKNIAIATTNGNIQIWETKNKKLLSLIDDHKFVVNTVSYSSNGDFLASGSMDKTVRIFETKNYTEIKHITFPEIVSSIAYSPDGKYLAVSCDDNTVSIINARDFSLRAKIEKTFFYISSTIFSNDGKYLAIGSHGDKIYLFDSSNFEVKIEIKHEQNAVKSMVFSNDSNSFFSGGEDGTIKEWRVKDGKNLRTLTNHNNMILSLAINEKDSILVAGSSFEQEYIDFWDLKTSKVIKKLNSNNKDINSLVFSKNDETLFILDGGGSLLTFTD